MPLAHVRAIKDASCARSTSQEQTRCASRGKQGVDVWNKWREEHPGIHPNFSGSNLTDTNLCAADLSDANLGELFLNYANLSNANLKSANLSAYPNNPAARKAIKPQAKWSNAR